MDDIRLDELSRDEWWDVVREAIRLDGARPVTREQFDIDWNEFEEIKRRKAMQ